MGEIVPSCGGERGKNLMKNLMDDGPKGIDVAKEGKHIRKNL